MHRSTSWIHKKVQAAGAQRPPGFLRRPPPRYPLLHDAGWMREQFAAGGSVHSIASTLGADRHTVRKAMVRHGLNRWPEQLVARYRPAAALEAEARRRQARVVDELLARGNNVAQVADALGITPSAVRRHRGG